MRMLLATIAAVIVTSNIVHAETLPEAMGKGLLKSDQLAAIQHSFIATRQNLIISNSANDLNASVNVTGSNSWTDAANKSGGFKSSATGKGTLTVSKQIFDSGEGAARMRAAELQLDSVRARYASVEQAVLLNIVTAYLDLITSRETVAISRANLQRLEAQTEAARIRLEAGTSTPTNLAQAESRLARAKSNLIQAQSDELVAEETYQSLIGAVPAQLQVPLMPANLPATILEAEDVALNFHPDILSALAAERAAVAQFDVLENAVKPKVKLNLSAGLTEITDSKMDKQEVTASIVFTSPILVTDGTIAKSRETAAKHNQAKSDSAESRRRVALGARSAFQNYVASAAQLDAVAAELQAANLVLEGTKSEVEFGLKTFLDELDAESAVNDALLRQVQTRQAVLQSAYRLKNALGQLTADEFSLEMAGIGLEGLVDPETPYGDPFSFFTDLSERLSFGE